MGNSNSIFDSLTSESGSAPKARKRAVGLLDKRSGELSDLASGAIQDKVHRWVDPARCKMWGKHNRRYDLLNENRCQDLIDGFKSQGKQEFPAIVRKVDGDPECDYEVVCGARRHWTVTWLRANNYPEFKYLIEVRDLTDEQAFRLSDIENRDKEDLSDYERAIDYKEALANYYSNQKEMAKRLEVSEAWLSRYLDLAGLPEVVVNSFGDVTQIRVKNGRDLKAYLKDKRSRGKILDKAKTLADEQAQRSTDGAAVLSSASVVKELIASAKTKQTVKRGALAEYANAKGEAILTVSRQGRSGLQLRVIPGRQASKTELLDACSKALEEFL